VKRTKRRHDPATAGSGCERGGNKCWTDRWIRYWLWSPKNQERRRKRRNTNPQELGDECAGRRLACSIVLRAVDVVPTETLRHRFHCHGQHSLPESQEMMSIDQQGKMNEREEDEKNYWETSIGQYLIETEESSQWNV
jgi:hypothetical protein